MPLLPQASYPPPGTAARSPLDQPLRQIVGLVNSSYGFFMEGGLGRSVQILWPGNYSSKMQSVTTGDRKKHNNITAKRS